MKRDAMTFNQTQHRDRSLWRFVAGLALAFSLTSGVRVFSEDLVDRRGMTSPLHGDVTEITRTEVEKVTHPSVLSPRRLRGERKPLV